MRDHIYPFTQDTIKSRRFFEYAHKMLHLTEFTKEDKWLGSICATTTTYDTLTFILPLPGLPCAVPSGAFLIIVLIINMYGKIFIKRRNKT